MRQQLGDRALVGVEDTDAEARREIAREGEVEEQVDGVHAAGVGHHAERLLRERGLARARDDRRRSQARAEAPALRLRAQLASEPGAGEEGALPRGVRSEVRREEGERQEGQRRRQLELDLERARRHLGMHAHALGAQLRAALEHAAVAVGPEHACEERGERDGAPRRARDALELVEEEARAERRLQHAVPRVAERAA